MWNLINNNLKILIDPFVFTHSDIQSISQRVCLIVTLKDYLNKLSPSICQVTFYHPTYLLQKPCLSKHRYREKEVTSIDTEPNEILDLIDVPEDATAEVKERAHIYNASIASAIQNKCAYILVDTSFDFKLKHDLVENHGIELVTLGKLHEIIESFLQGFYNYYKMSQPLYGVGSPDLAHAMTDQFFNKVLLPWEQQHRSKVSEQGKERLRSFVHNRYVDILVTIDHISFTKIQQRLHDLENNLVGNKEPHLQGSVRYYVNYYLFLLWGALDHLAWIINDIFHFDYRPEKFKDRKTVGLSYYSEKKIFIDRITPISSKLHKYIISKEFQEWMRLFGQLRHQSAHREMVTSSPLLLTTDESDITDDQIDAIIYKDRKPIPEEDSVKKVFGEEKFKLIEENQRIIDRTNYRVSKMKKGLEQFVSVKKDGQQYIFDPVARVTTDLNKLKTLIQLIADVKIEGNNHQKN